MVIPARSDNGGPARVLVLGATGMLGNAVLRWLAAHPGYDVMGSVRSAAGLRLLREDLRARVHVGVNVESPDSLARLLDSTRPHAVVNCVGMVKQRAEAEDPLAALPLNSLLPHRLASLCSLVGARLVHISTDCVYSGSKGGYRETDAADAQDLYGRSKLLGEVDYANAVTLRTSIIGHELATEHSLIGWFLAQSGTIRGYRRAVFSGLPTVELARVIGDYVLPAPALRGLYHVSAEPIDKFALLQLVARQYGKAAELVADDTVIIDRSLDSQRFRTATGYAPPPWPELVRRMQAFG